jgi:hypothetical protein
VPDDLQALIGSVITGAPALAALLVALAGANDDVLRQLLAEAITVDLDVTPDARA